MDVVVSVNGVPIRLTDERWDHIVRRHEALAGRKSDVLETVREPVAVAAGDAGELMAFRRIEGWWIVVPYREVDETDGFVITAFLSREDPAKDRHIVWP